VFTEETASRVANCAIIGVWIVHGNRGPMSDFLYIARPIDRLSSRPVFSPAEWIRLAAFYGFIASLHLLGWGLYLHYAGRYPQLVGLGFAAYVFGLRHAFDADHIAAVDDTVRFMLQKGRQPLGVGFFFSLGHSTVVLALAIGIAFAVMDTTDGVLMCKAYDWAFLNPLRKIFYNITTTGLSVAVALLVGTIELFAGVHRHYRPARRSFRFHRRPRLRNTGLPDCRHVPGGVGAVGGLLEIWPHRAALSHGPWAALALARP
jgi:High-affinity nickel-transport protein